MPPWPFVHPPQALLFVKDRKLGAKAVQMNRSLLHANTPYKTDGESKMAVDKESVKLKEGWT